MSGAGLQGEPPLTAARSRAAPAVLGAAANQILLQGVIPLQGQVSGVAERFVSMGTRSMRPARGASAQCSAVRTP